MSFRLLLALALAAGCTGDKPAADDSFTELAGLDEKSDTFTGKLTIVGSIDYGQTEGPFAHKAGKWSALKFAGDAGDQVSVDVTSKDGDTVAWVLDNDFNILGYNDDASRRTTNSHIDVTLPANASRTHYIVTRDYYRGAMHFSVALKGKKASFDSPCKVDADCARVRPDCCQLQDWIAVRADEVDAFRASLGCPASQICPKIAVRDNRASAECQSGKCVAVLPKDVQCGGRSTNPHNCPDSYECRGPQLAVDGTGSCVQQCGGFANLGCDDVSQSCVDDPTDGCDPKNGGADCPGICVSADAG